MQSTETRTEVLLLYAVLAIATTPTAAKTSLFKGLLCFHTLLQLSQLAKNVQVGEFFLGTNKV